ncbi:MAG: transporter substrate-binding domain-containing protein [Erysipelotrichaceae bacterium]
MKKLSLIFILFLLVGCTNNTKKETITMGSECNCSPFNWTTLDKASESILIDGGTAGYCDGYDIQIGKIIAQELNKELVVKKIEWDGLSIAVNNGEIDMIIAGMTDTPERRNGLDFSNPYYESDMVMVVRKDSKYVNSKSIQDFNGANVVGQLNTFHDKIIDQIEGVNHVTPMKNIPIMIVAVAKNDVDALVTEYPIAASAVKTNPDLAIVQFDQGKGFTTGSSSTVSVGIKKGNLELVDKINKILDKINKEQRNEIMKNALSRAKNE